MRPVAVQPAVWQRVDVLSPDTLVVDGRHIHLANAFAPQPVPYAKCRAEILAERTSREVVSDMMREAHTIDVRPTGEVDGWNRTVAYVTLDGQDLGETLKDKGYAGPSEFNWCDPLSAPTPKGTPDPSRVMGLGGG